MKTFVLAAFLAFAFTATGTAAAFADNSYAESVWKRLSENGG